MVHAQRARGLRHALDQKHARHDRIAREVPLKVRLVRGDVLDAGGGAVPVHVDDAVDKEERIAMWQQLEDVGGLRPPQLRFCAALIHPHSLLMRPEIPSRHHPYHRTSVLALGELAQDGKLAKPQARRFGRGSPHLTPGGTLPRTLLLPAIWAPVPILT
jgi:hypothetical protein